MKSKFSFAQLSMIYILITIVSIGFITVSLNSEEKQMNDSIYKFSAKTITGQEKSLSDYSGKVLLIVNTASKCGFTKQYEGLENIYKQYADKGFMILGFPCNQFGSQEPGTNAEVAEFCKMNFGVSFDMFEKIDVNGDNAHPLYKFLVSQKGGLITDSIKWNFTKFLIDKEGKVVKRFAPQTTPESITKDIEKLL